MLSEQAKDILSCLQIMEKSGELKKASWVAVCEFCHILTEASVRAFVELYVKGYIIYQETKGGFKNIKIL